MRQMKATNLFKVALHLDCGGCREKKKKFFYIFLPCFPCLCNASCAERFDKFFGAKMDSLEKKKYLIGAGARGCCRSVKGARVSERNEIPDFFPLRRKDQPWP
jgi:hypothetical protein